MVDVKYAVAYNEVLEILKYIPEEDYNKIPKKKIELFETCASKETEFSYNPEKTLDEQNVSKIAKGIIAILFRDYWATPEQRKRIIKKQNKERMEMEKEKAEKYSANVFEKSSTNTSQVISETNEGTTTTALVNQEKWYTQFANFIKRLFGNK